MLLIRRLSNEARLFQSFQPVGKNVGGNPFERILQLSIGHIALEQVPNHKQRPLVANQVERACDSAFCGPGSCLIWPVWRDFADCSLRGPEKRPGLKMGFSPQPRGAACHPLYWIVALFGKSVRSRGEA